MASVMSLTYSWLKYSHLLHTMYAVTCKQTSNIEVFDPEGSSLCAAYGCVCVGAT
jgi:hypothetical protein